MLHEAGQSESAVRVRKVARHLIYGLRDENSNEIRYIGKSSYGLSRPRSHWRYYKDDGYPVHLWVSDILKQGRIPEIIILNEFWELEHEPIDEKNRILNESEVFLIAEYRLLGHRLLNMTDGGDGQLGRSGNKHPLFGRRGRLSHRFGKKHTDESRKRMSESLSGENHPMYGKSPSFITRKKIGDANRGENNGMFGKKPKNAGTHLSEEKKENLRKKCGKMVQCINDGRIFYSQVEAAEFYKIDRSTVGQLCRDRIKSSVDGLKFRFMDKVKP